jgi:hypothetical protein
MIGSGRLLVFSMVGAVAYVLSYNFGWQLFAYYPQVRQFLWSASLPKAAGPAMMYYGWLSTAALAGLAAALIIPPKWSGRLWPVAAWLIPLILIAFTLVYERRWFL